jgi:hypothetical protein
LNPRNRITNKYDLMHYNTPSFASTVVTWDCSKLTPITYKRVLNALKTGSIKYRSGDAASMYEAVRKQFEIPQFRLDEPKKSKNGQAYGGYIHWDFLTDKLYDALELVYQTERVSRRLAGDWMPWYLEADHLDKTRNYLYVEHEQNFNEVRVEMDKVMNSEEVAKKRRDAINFLQDGGKLEFTWGV